MASIDELTQQKTTASNHSSSSKRYDPLRSCCCACFCCFTWREKLVGRLCGATNVGNSVPHNSGTMPAAGHVCPSQPSGTAVRGTMMVEVPKPNTLGTRCAVTSCACFVASHGGRDSWTGYVELQTCYYCCRHLTPYHIHTRPAAGHVYLS